MDEFWRHAKIKEPVPKKQILYFIYASSWSHQIHEDRRYNGGCQGLGEGEDRELGVEWVVLDGEDKCSGNERWLMEEKELKCHWAVYKWLNGESCIIYHSLKE